MAFNTGPDLGIDKVPRYVRRCQIQIDDECKARYRDPNNAILHVSITRISSVVIREFLQGPQDEDACQGKLLCPR